MPSFMVRVDSQKHIDFALNSPFGGGRPGRNKRKALKCAPASHCQAQRLKYLHALALHPGLTLGWARGVGLPPPCLAEEIFHGWKDMPQQEGLPVLCRAVFEGPVGQGLCKLLQARDSNSLTCYIHAGARRVVARRRVKRRRTTMRSRLATDAATELAAALLLSSVISLSSVQHLHVLFPACAATRWESL